MKKVVVVQSSLREKSNTAILCETLELKLTEKNIPNSGLDLRNMELQFCNGASLESYNSDMQSAYQQMSEADIIIFGMPVYQYSMSGVLKNFIDVCGGALAGKQIGVLVNAGGPNGYMASRDLLDCLYYEYATTNISPTPYAWSMDFVDGAIANKKVLEKIDELVEVIAA